MLDEFMQKDKGRINAQIQTKGFFISHHSNTDVPEVILYKYRYKNLKQTNNSVTCFQ